MSYSYYSKGAKYFTALGLSQGSCFLIHLRSNLFGLDKTSNKSQGSGYLAYLDDILIYSNNEKEHLKMLNNAFELSHKASLKLKMSKCSFLRKKVII